MSGIETSSRVAAVPRPWFAADAVVTGANAVIYLLAASALTGLLGAEEATYRAVGAFLLVYAVGVAAYTWSSVGARAGWLIVAANELWVAASLVVAALGGFDLNAVGRTWVVLQAVVVGALAVLQSRALRRDR